MKHPISSQLLSRHSFFTLRSLCFLQLIGIAIGSDPFPFTEKFNSMLLWKEREKQPLRGVPRKRCSENMQQMYRRTPMRKCDFNKVATLLKSHFGMGVLLPNLQHIFRTPFLKNTSEWLHLKVASSHKKITPGKGSYILKYISVYRRPMHI